MVEIRSPRRHALCHHRARRNRTPCRRRGVLRPNRTAFRGRAGADVRWSWTDAHLIRHRAGSPAKPLADRPLLASRPRSTLASSREGASRSSCRPTIRARLGTSYARTACRRGSPVERDAAAQIRRGLSCPYLWDDHRRESRICIGASNRHPWILRATSSLNMFASAYCFTHRGRRGATRRSGAFSTPSADCSCLSPPRQATR